MNNTNNYRRSHRVRTTIRKGGSVLPRLSVFRSNKYLSVQIIDDMTGTTMASAHIKEINNFEKLTRMEQATALGKLIADKAKKGKIQAVLFDRGSYAYHGLVRSIAEGAREGGLNF